MIAQLKTRIQALEGELEGERAKSEAAQKSLAEKETAEAAAFTSTAAEKGGSAPAEGRRGPGGGG